jgi:predicted ATP-binding protein involved in virulence
VDFVLRPEEHQGLYERLSAGQRIVLNIVCHVVTNIRRDSLLLIDEPETHLHPKLATTLLSIINDLLETFQSVAIVATHSPLVVQQIPSRRVHIVQRHASQPVVSKPRIECFGENLTDIAREVFQAVESDRDYEQVIDKLLAENNNDSKLVERLFEGGLGLNARIYLVSRARQAKG